MSAGNFKIEDKLLLRKAACQGCRESLAIIYGKYKPVICSYLKRAGAGSIAEDICHTLFVNISNGKYNYDCRANVDDYLCLLAKNILRNHRKLKSETLYPPKQIDELYSQRKIYTQPDLLEKAEEYKFLEILTAELPPKSRQAIEAFTINPKKSKGIIAAGNSPDTFRKRLRYAIKLLKRKFNKI